jgi:VCBS repeat-containing protein
MKTQPPPASASLQAKHPSDALRRDARTEPGRENPAEDQEAALRDPAAEAGVVEEHRSFEVASLEAGAAAAGGSAGSAPAGENQPIVVREVSSGGGWQAWLIPAGVLATGGIIAAVNDGGGGGGGSSGDAAPIILTNGGKDTAAITLAENKTSVTDVNASDADSKSLTFSISGADADKFNISTTTGVLTFRDGPDFEAKADAGGDNVYDVIVKVADDEGHSDTQAIAVTVTNLIVEAAADTYTVDEDNTLTVAVADGVLKNDQQDDAAALTVQVVSGVTKGTLALNPDGSFTYTPNKDFAGTDSFTYKAGDGTNTDTATVTITVNAKDNDPPVVNDQTFKIAENSVKDSVVGTVAATDPDSGDTRTFALSDDSVFDIDPQTGKLTVGDASKLDFETNPQFVLTVIVTDKSGQSDDAVITIDLTDVAESGQTSAYMGDTGSTAQEDLFAYAPPDPGFG